MINLFSHEMFEPADVLGASSGVLSLFSHKNAMDCLNHFKRLECSKISVIQKRFAIKMNKITAENQLKTDIQRAINDVRAAEKSYTVAEKSLKATKASAENTKKRFDLGVVNSFEMVSVQNMLISAESSLLQAKYDFIFKLKVLDYYKGITLTGN
jgi:outer membrane protein